MTRYSAKNLVVGAAARRLMLTATVLAISGTIALPEASACVGAAVPAGDGNGIGNKIRVIAGNGKFNKNYSAVIAPTINKGLQQISNTNVSGSTTTQTAICKRHRVCKI